MCKKLSDKHWTVLPTEGGSSYVELKDTQSEASFNVRINRVKKAKLHLEWSDCLRPMRRQACECKRNCYGLIKDAEKIRDIRAPIYCLCEDETDVTNYLLNDIQSHKGAMKVYVPRGGKKNEFKAHTVCRLYYATLHGVSVGKLQRIITAARNGSGRKVPKPYRMPKRGPKRDVAIAFWDMFFEQNCQRPNGETRLFPTSKTYKQIYAEYFKPWFQRQVDAGYKRKKDKPAYNRWLAARYMEQFQDVKERPKHTHSICPTCDELRELCLAAFKDGKAEREYQQRRRIHNEEVSAWRSHEETLKSKAVSMPEDYLVLAHDATGAFGCPRIGSRTLKNLSPVRFEVIPWLVIDYSTGSKDYIYCPKVSYSKDKNYLISQVHAAIRRAKADYSHPRHKARTLIMIADSAAENKNNELLAYLTDLVDNGWFDTVELHFGPVGHTHNGVDATHKDHNQSLARYAAGDLGHLVLNYCKVWGGVRHKGKAPTANVLAKVLDWKEYYRPYLRPIGGFRKTTEYSCVRAFRVARTPNGTEVTFKRDPASKYEKEWSGRDGTSSNGFFMLTAKPEGAPKAMQKNEIAQDQLDGFKALLGPAWQGWLRAQGLEACARWNYQAATSGEVPVHQYLEEKPQMGRMGRLAEIGAIPAHRAVVGIIDQYWEGEATREALWSLPVGLEGEHIAATRNLQHYTTDPEVSARAPIPNVWYQDEHKAEMRQARRNKKAGQWVADDEPSAPVAEQPQARVAEAPSLQSDLQARAADKPQARAAEAPSQQSDRQAQENDANAPPQPRRFEVPFDECKVNRFCVGLAETTNGPSPYIWVGKVLRVCSENKTFTTKSLLCNIDTWKEECVTLGSWFMPASKKNQTEETVKHYSVMAYFPNLTKQHKLPAAAKKAVDEREINWFQDGTDPDSSSQSESDSDFQPPS